MPPETLVVTEHPTERFCRAWRSSLAIAKKNAKIYYLKPPVLIFGLLFPFFMFLAFAVGRGLQPASMVPALLGMTILFTASSVGPLISPWERQAKTYERLLCAPVSLWHIVFGDVGAGFLYGLVISLLPLALGVWAFGAHLDHPVAFIATMLLAVYCFAALGALLAALPTDQPSNVMMLSNLVRLPLLFISGIFIPLEQMPAWGRTVALLSPLSYAMELLCWSFGQPPSLGAVPAYLVLLGFTLLFLCLARLAHQRGLRKPYENPSKHCYSSSPLKCFSSRRAS